MEEMGMKKTKVSEVLDDKGSEIRTISKDETVSAAATRMIVNNVGSLIVTHAGGIAGIVTERDCLRNVADENADSHTTRVGDIMTSDIIVANSDDTVLGCLSLMTEKRFRHLPVVEGKRIVGILSIGDLVKAAIEDQKTEIHYLNEYIQGGYPALSAAPS
jgi:CBS domain-containing protein